MIASLGQPFKSCVEVFFKVVARTKGIRATTAIIAVMEVDAPVLPPLHQEWGCWVAELIIEIDFSSKLDPKVSGALYP
jgi:hypothetical protein